MSKVKSFRIGIVIECIECRKGALNKRTVGISRYTTFKNRKNNSEKLSIRKFCRFCNVRTLHTEIKK